MMVVTGDKTVHLLSVRQLAGDALIFGGVIAWVAFAITRENFSDWSTLFVHDANHHLRCNLDTAGRSVGGSGRRGAAARVFGPAGGVAPAPLPFDRERDGARVTSRMRVSLDEQKTLR